MSKIPFNEYYISVKTNNKLKSGSGCVIIQTIQPANEEGIPSNPNEDILTLDEVYEELSQFVANKDDIVTVGRNIVGYDNDFVVVDSEIDED